MARLIGEADPDGRSRIRLRVHGEIGTKFEVHDHGVDRSRMPVHPAMINQLGRRPAARPRIRLATHRGCSGFQWVIGCSNCPDSGTNRRNIRHRPGVRYLVIDALARANTCLRRAPKPCCGTILRGAAALVLAFGPAAVPAVSAAATIAVTAERQGDAIDIRASTVLNADPATAWRVLTGYDRYTEFIPDLRVSRVVARRGATVTVEQSGDATLWLFRMPLDITFEIDESPPVALHSRAVAGSLRALASSYTLTPAASGVRLDYAGHITPGFALFGGLEQMAVRQNVARQFQALADEIEARGAAVRVRDAASVR
jgi:hypothetical protein